MRYLSDAISHHLYYCIFMVGEKLRGNKILKYLRIILCRVVLKKHEIQLACHFFLPVSMAHG